MHSSRSKHRVVLLGIGHTNAHVLRMWRMKARKNTRLVCISDFRVATYSGMLPGVLAGQYPPERMEMDLDRLCASSGAELIVDRVVGLDAGNKLLLLANRRELPFDVLSVGIGSRPSIPAKVPINAEMLIPIKPMQTFLSRLDARLSFVRQMRQNAPVRIVVVGAGLGGTEIALCLSQRLRTLDPECRFEIKIVTSDLHVASECRPATVKFTEQALEIRKIDIIAGQRVTGLHDSQLNLANGKSVDCDIAIWATGAVAPKLFSKFGLPTDEKGFLSTESTLLVEGQDSVFAVGDSGTIRSSPARKAGVYAVRQGPILWRNIHHVLDGTALKKYRPQRDFLTLLNLGDGTAIAQYAGASVKGKWCWLLKNYIDTKFMDKYQDDLHP